MMITRMKINTIFHPEQNTHRKTFYIIAHHYKHFILFSLSRACVFFQLIDIAKKVTNISNDEAKAITEFKKILSNVSVSFFNKEPIPKNESEGAAFTLCKTVEGAKKYCPNRWKAMEAWFAFARMVSEYKKQLHFFCVKYEHSADFYVLALIFQPKTDWQKIVCSFRQI